MSARPARDRLDVWTYFEDGEEIPLGHPAVTDAERAAAGRETCAERWQALLPVNRSRAAERYTAGGLPDGQNVARVWRPRDPPTLRNRLAGAPLAVWAEDDVLHVLWRGAAGEVHLGGGIQPRLWPVEGASDLWEASLRVRRLDEAVISIIVMPLRAGEDWRGPSSRPPDTLEWRGPRAPAAQAAGPLGGTVEEHTFDSATLGAPRGLTVYRPPGATGPLPGCVLADGQSARGFAQVLEPAIIAGDVPPVLLVGVHSAAANPARPWPDRRTQEYIPGYSRRRFAAHLRFVTGEVIPWAVGHAGAADGPWVAAGFSNGGAWAIGAAQRRPDIFPAVAAFSAGSVPGQLTRSSRTARVRHYLAAGTLEAGFRTATRQWAQRLERAGLPCRYREWVGGHDSLWWDQQLPAALAWLLAPSADLPRIFHHEYGDNTDVIMTKSRGKWRAVAARGPLTTGAGRDHDAGVAPPASRWSASSA